MQIFLLTVHFITWPIGLTVIPFQLLLVVTSVTVKCDEQLLELWDKLFTLNQKFGNRPVWPTKADLSEAARKAGINLDDMESVFLMRKLDFYIAFNKNTPPAVVQQWQKELDAIRKWRWARAFIGIASASIDNSAAGAYSIPATSALAKTTCLVDERHRRQPLPG